MLVLRKRLSIVMKPDTHTADGKYSIRSLYFDTPDDKALREKLDGIGRREKYRIRIYNNDVSFIRLEKKVKLNGVGYKESCRLDTSETRALISGEFGILSNRTESVIRDFCDSFRFDGLRAKVIVDYVREPFVYDIGNVRVTLDYDIRTALRITDLFDPDCATVPVDGSPCILEVKWDNFLCDVVRDAVQLGDRHASSYSKYAACRMYN